MASISFVCQWGPSMWLLLEIVRWLIAVPAGLIFALCVLNDAMALIGLCFKPRKEGRSFMPVFGPVAGLVFFLCVPISGAARFWDIAKASDVAVRYGVDRVPTFIVVDGGGRELDRTHGPQSAGALAKFDLAAKAKARPPENSNAHFGAHERPGDDSEDDDNEPARPGERVTRAQDPDDRPEPETRRPATFANPHPAETVVRIKIMGPHSTGFGSGTIIHSTPEQSLILTCAHIFKLEGRRQASPAEFPRKIVIDLFDGKLRGTNPAQVGYLESVDGKAVDYDFNRDVGLIRIRPGRKLPASRVVPTQWEPRSPMKMLTLGCSEGNDATAWYTKILNPRMHGLSGNPAYEAIECWNAPKQGRSGGGLFTADFYIAGVCNFAEPRGNHGLYATPRSIYQILDRNKLAALYAPVGNGSDSGILLADDRPPTRSPSPRPNRTRRTLTPVARAQSSDSEERSLRRAVAGQGEVMLPHPKLLEIPDPVNTGDPVPQAASGSTRRTAWQPIPTIPDHEVPGPVSEAAERKHVMRGGSFDNPPSRMRASYR